MHRRVKKITILTIGALFILLGLLGLALPFLQGFLFLAIGLVLISLYSLSLRTWAEKYRKRYPKLHKTMEKIEAWVTRFIGQP